MIGEWDEGTLARFIEDRVLSDPRLVALPGGTVRAPTYTVATRPTNVGAGTVIFVSDGGAGAVFQGWNGAAWVNLG